MPSPVTLTPERFAQHLRLAPGASKRVYWPGCAGASPWFEGCLTQHADDLAGVDFCGVWIPGVNRFDPAALHPQARATSFFLQPDLQASWQRGALTYLPLHYSDISRHLATPGRFDLCLLHVAPPDDAGQCSLSVACDFTPDVLQGLRADALVLAHVNPRLPRTRGPSVPVSRIQAWVHADTPVLTVADAVFNRNDPLVQVAQQVAKLVDDGDTVQLGLGRLQGAVLAQLKHHRQLRVHAGMVSDGLLGLLQAGALADRSMQHPPVCTGVALGSLALYGAVADPALVRFAPVSHTHAHSTLVALPRLKAINSFLQIDLLGQVNVDRLAGRQVSGLGGLVDFLRGARGSDGGLGIVAGTATVGADGAPRIVPLLPPGAVGIARSDVDTVVTEQGAAHLRHLGVAERAQALIRIAAPHHQAALQSAWHTLRRTL
jgi:acyl-CoA hydrolase